MQEFSKRLDILRQLRNDEAHGSIDASEQEVNAAIDIVIDMYLFAIGTNITGLEDNGLYANDGKQLITPAQHKYVPYTLPEEDYADEDDFAIAAEDIIIPYSVEVRLWNTKREELLNGDLDLILMYAIGPLARHKTESAGKIALGVKEDKLLAEAVKAYKSVQYIMFHYWKNEEATPFRLTAPVRIVDKEDVPEDFLLRQEKDAKQFLLLEYDAKCPANLEDFDILKAQRKKSDRYMPFVCRMENIKKV